MADLSHPEALRRAYDDLDDAGEPPPISLVERTLLCDTFERFGPAAATLSGAWNVHQLAAHLVLRERNPVTSVRSALSKDGHDAEVRAYAERETLPGLVRRLRSRPSAWSVFAVPRLERELNALEMFVHHEDVLRAGSTWTPRVLPRWAEDQLWSRLRLLAKLSMRTSPVPVSLQRTDADEPPVTAAKGPRPVIAYGRPSELTLLAYGRGQVASYELVGTDRADDGAAKLRSARFRV